LGLTIITLELTQVYICEQITKFGHKKKLCLRDLKTKGFVWLGQLAQVPASQCCCCYVRSRSRQSEGVLAAAMATDGCNLDNSGTCPSAVDWLVGQPAVSVGAGLLILLFYILSPNIWPFF
jgi:hypothetical protein